MIEIYVPAELIWDSINAERLRNAMIDAVNETMARQLDRLFLGCAEPDYEVQPDHICDV